MQPINLNLPPGAQVRGELLDSTATECLLQDILIVRLPNGIVIDVGWHPECDPNGSFRVVVYRDHWRNQLEPPLTTRELRDVALAIERLAHQYATAPPSAVGQMPSVNAPARS